MLLAGVILVGLLVVVAEVGAPGVPAAHRYATEGRVERLRKLIENDPQVLALRDDAGRTPLHAAAAAGNEKVAAMLLERKAAVDARDGEGMTPLQCAAAGGHRQVVELLLRAGADPRARNAKGETAAELAGRGGHQAAKAQLDEALRSK